MKNIQESFHNMPDLSNYLEKSSRVDEGLRDIWNKLKEKFNQVVKYLTGFVAKLGKGSYWCPCDDEGEILPAISPLTAGQAYVDGEIDKDSTLVCLDRTGSRATGCKTKPNDVLNLYGSESIIDYWSQMVKESTNLNAKANINEVKMQTDDPNARWGRNVFDTPGLLREIKMALASSNHKLLILGAPGIGKTAIVQNIVKSLPDGNEWATIFKTLSNETPDNFFLPAYEGEGADRRAIDIPKTWLPVYKETGDKAKDDEADAACGKGLLFVDELSRATPQVLNVILPLINEGMFNGYKVGSGWRIICASNRPWQDDSNQSELNATLMNRFRVIYYEPTVKSWSEWAKTKKYISPVLLDWLNMPESENMSGSKFFYMDPNEESDDGMGINTYMCTPRSWDNAMRTLAIMADATSLEGFTIFDIYRQDKSIIEQALGGFIPLAAIDSFMAFLEVISRVGDVGLISKDVWKNNGSSSKIDSKSLRKVALPLAQVIISSHAKELPTTEEFTSLCTWLASLKSDQMASYVLDICQEVFGGMLPENSRGGIFVIKAKYDMESKKNNETGISQLDSFFGAFLKKWGLNWDTVPNWYPGLQILKKAYGESFKAEIDGKSALG